MRYHLLIILIALVGLGLTPYMVHGHTAYNVDSPMLKAGELVVVTFEINTLGQSVNALETGLIFPSKTLEFVSSNDSDSVLGQWIEKPFLSSSSTVTFSGIVPGGFLSSAEPIVSLTFLVKEPGVVTFALLDPVVLLNDGMGTPVVDPYDSFKMFVTNGSEAVSEDTEMPEDFTPEIMSDPDVENGKAVLIFSTNDTGSGMHHYEVKEGRFGEYRRSESPYLIDNQKRNQTLYVKAVDNAGNERVSILYPTSTQPWHLKVMVIALLLGLCIVVVFGLRKMRGC